MRIGILADTHDDLARTQLAVKLLIAQGVEAIIHCGDLNSPSIVYVCSVVPFYFTFGNHDADMVAQLRQRALEVGAVCLGWGDVVELSGKRIGVTHGHMTIDVRRVLAMNRGRGLQNKERNYDPSEGSV